MSPNSISRISNLFRRGQVMLLSVLSIGAVMLGATAVAGLLMVYQIRTTSDAADSAKAVFAADAGIEWGIYQYSRSTSTASAPSFSNGASYAVTCYDSSLRQISCADSAVAVIRASGRAGGANRAFELEL